MFIKSWEATPIKNTKDVEMVCGNCGNETNHQIYEVPRFGIGLIFIKKPLLATKKYYFICLVCTNTTKQISKDEVNAHKI